MDTIDKWPDIIALIEEAERTGEKDKLIKALDIIAITPPARKPFRAYFIEKNIIDAQQFNDYMTLHAPDFQPLLGKDYLYIRPALDFIRDKDMSITTVEIVASIKHSDGENVDFKEETVPAFITSFGQLLECSDEELTKFNLTARTIPSQALKRWHPHDVAEYIESMKKDVQPAVDLSHIYNEIRSSFTSYVYFEKPVIYDFMSVYVIATYFHPLFQAFPLLVLYGPTESGKSLTMQIIEYLAFNAVMITDPTPAVIFRTIEELCPTMLMDEIEGLASRRDYASSIMSILRASYKRIDVPRMEEKPGGGFRLKLYCCYSPKVIGTIQGVENVLANRSVIINLVRSRQEDGAKFEKTDPSLKEEHWRQLRNYLYLLVMTRWQELEAMIEPTIEELEGDLTNRQLELWTPFLSVASWIDQNNRDGDRSLFTRLLDMAQQKLSERRMIDREGNQTLMVLQALLQLVKKPKDKPWYSTHEIKEQLEKFYSEPQGWINEVWIGRIMNQIGIVKSRRKPYKTEFIGEKKLTHYWIDPEWLKDYCERYGVEITEHEEG